ncbi:hypothetical protein C8R46DRAFT_437834 [Mycena filopes]|nr:hypothetical protein C8R46DRAFT_437834 [Mycena filopes]
MSRGGFVFPPNDMTFDSPQNAPLPSSRKSRVIAHIDSSAFSSSLWVKSAHIHPHQRFATPAAHGSIPDLRRLMHHLYDAEDPAKYRKCLPIFYLCLDPAGIPTEDDLTADTVTGALEALTVLHQITDWKKIVPWPELWPRIWAWLVFFHTYHESLPPAFALLDRFFVFLRFIAVEEIWPMLGSTTGFGMLFVDAWVFHLDGKAGAYPPLHFYKFSLALHQLRGMTPTTFTEIVEGANGLNGLASLVVRSIRHFLPTQPLPLLPSASLFFGHIVDFLGACLELTEAKPLFSALVAAGAAKSLTSAACLITNSPALQESRSNLNVCFRVLQYLLATPHAIRKSLAAGLLGALIRTAATPLPPASTGSNWDVLVLIARMLPAFTVYSTVLTELERQLHALEETAELKESDFYDDWKSFVALARERITFMNELNSSKVRPLKACDNLECGVIRERANFRCCSWCKRVYYCSRDCQRKDWNNGAHRKSCTSHQPSWADTELSPRNYAFICALLQRDLAEHHYTEPRPIHDHSRFTYLRQKVQAFPTRPLLTYFNYTARPTMLITDASAGKREDKAGQIPWDECIQRAMRGAGRVEMHLVIIVCGRDFKRILLMQRSQGPSFHAGLLALLLKEPDGFDAVEAIRELRMADEGTVKIY